MRIFTLIAGITLLFALTSCKKGPEQPPSTPKKTDKQALDEAPKEKPEEKKSESPTATEEIAKKEEAKPREEEVAPDPVADKRLPAEEKSSEICKERIAAEDRRIKREVIPMMRAEQDAMEAVKRWAQKAYDVLEPEESALAKVKIDAFWKEYGTCIKEIEAPKAERDPECVAYVTGDASACQRLGNGEIRKRCADTVRTKEWEKSLFDWAKSGFSAKYCAKATKATAILPPALCAVFADGGECSSDAFYGHLTKLCEAANAGLEGKGCSDKFPEGSEYCRMLNIVKDPNRGQLCRDAVAAGELSIPADVCPGKEELTRLDCSQLPRDVGPNSQPFPEKECSLLKALRAGATTCEGLYAADSDDCAVLISVQASLKDDRSLCDTLGKRERAQMRCRTFLSTKVEDCDLKTSSEWGTGPKDDTPCRKLLWDQKVLPASEGRTEVRVTFVNPFDNPASCSVEMKVSATGSTSSQTETIDLKEAEVKVHSLFFLGGPDSKVELVPTCKWDRVMKVQPEREAK